MPAVLVLRLKVNPRSSRDRVVGWVGERLKVAVSAPPEKGRANEAVIRVLARTLDVPRSRIRLVSGETASEKAVALYDVSELAVFSRLPAR